jgi:hypothetical protein
MVSHRMKQCSFDSHPRVSGLLSPSGVSDKGFLNRVGERSVADAKKFGELGCRWDVDPGGRVEGDEGSCMFVTTAREGQVSLQIKDI